jgi:hypothetical protein
MRTFHGQPVYFHPHAVDGMEAEELRVDDVLLAMESGATIFRRSGRAEVSYTRGRKIILVRYDQMEDHVFVVSVSQRFR